MPTPEDNLKAPAQTAQKAAGAVKSAKQIIQTAKLVGAAGTGPLGWAVALAPYLAKFQDQIKKVIGAAVGLGAYLLYMLWLKFLGMLAGLAFGAITGLPLLLIPGAGPFLYAGWTGFWTMRGIADPTGTINLATHPWEAITKPFGWIQGQFSGLGGGFESAGSTVAQGTATAASATGSFATGLGSALWNGATTLAGNSLGWLSAGLGKGLGLLSTAGSTVAGMASTAVGWTLGLTVTTAYAATIVTNSAHFSPEGDLGGILNPPPSANDIFSITKTVDQPIMGNLGGTAIFTIKVEAKKNIKSLTITDNLTRKTGITNPTVSCTPQSALPIILAAGASCTGTFQLGVDNTDTNSIITNTITASAIAEDDTTANGSATATVRVGTPATNDPSGWPSCGYIAQGPYQDPTHNHFRSMSAVDVQTDASGMGDNVYATQDGTVTSVMTLSTNPLGGNGVIITGTNYATLYAHFGIDGEDGGVAPGITVGSWVTAGTLIGFRGDSGNPILPHVHYSILDTALNDISEADFLAHVPAFTVGDTVDSTWGPCK